MKTRTYLGVLFAAVLALSLSRYYKDHVTFEGIERGELTTCGHEFPEGYWFRIYIRPTFLFGGLWGSEMFIADSKGDRLKRICNFYSEEWFLLLLERTLSDGDGPKCSSIEDVKVLTGLGTPNAARDASPKWLFLIDTLAVCLVLNVIYLVDKIKHRDSKGTVPVEGRYVAAGIQGQVCIASMGKVNKLCTEGNVDDSADGRGAESQ